MHLADWQRFLFAAGSKGVSFLRHICTGWAGVSAWKN